MAQTTLFPITLDGERLGVRLHPPTLGEHTRELLAELGYGDAQVDAMHADAAVS
jgi:crotonobetainyl-CoA:carnitine CoA-transferase CaiB-like acyl-CoA transferase